MSTQPEAMRLAAVLDDPRMVVFFEQRCKAAAELRFLHAENEELRRERDEARRTVREAHEAGTRLTAQRDALLRALNMAVQWVEEYASQMRAYTTSEQANADLSVIYAAIKMAEEGK